MGLDRTFYTFYPHTLVNSFLLRYSQDVLCHTLLLKVLNRIRKDLDHKKSFRDARLPFTEAQVKAETARCLGCGASVVDPNKCIGCGVCTTKCEFGAIKLRRERPECSNMIPSEKKLPYVLGNGAKQALKIKFSGKKEK